MSSVLIPTTPERQEPEQEIRSNPFWPIIEPQDLRESMRIDNTVTTAQLYHAAIEAVTHVNHLLKKWREEKQNSGIISTQDLIDDDAINGLSMQTQRYIHAVYSFTKAQIINKYLDFDSTAQAETKAHAKVEQAGKYQRDGHAAIADILRKTRVNSRLV